MNRLRKCTNIFAICATFGSKCYLYTSRKIKNGCAQVMINWDKFDTNQHFLHCIPLNIGASLIAFLGILYSLLGLHYSVVMTINLNQWTEVYKNKLDLFAYLYLFFFFVALLSLPSVVLMLGVLLRRQLPILFFLYCSLIHIFCIWTITLGVSVYCVFINEICFMGSGKGQAVMAIVFATSYSFVWIYIIACVNSFRKLSVSGVKAQTQTSRQQPNAVRISPRAAVPRQMPRPHTNLTPAITPLAAQQQKPKLPNNLVRTIAPVTTTLSQKSRSSTPVRGLPVSSQPQKPGSSNNLARVTAPVTAHQLKPEVPRGLGRAIVPSTTRQNPEAPKNPAQAAASRSRVSRT